MMSISSFARGANTMTSPGRISSMRLISSISAGSSVCATSVSVGMVGRTMASEPTGMVGAMEFESTVRGTAPAIVGMTIARLAMNSTASSSPTLRMPPTVAKIRFATPRRGRGAGAPTTPAAMMGAGVVDSPVVAAVTTAAGGVGRPATATVR